MAMELTNVLYEVLFTFDYVMCFTTSNNDNLKGGIGPDVARSGCFSLFKHNLAYMCVSMAWRHSVIDRIICMVQFLEIHNMKLCTLCLMFSVMALWPCVWICLHESTQAHVLWADICFAGETWTGSTQGKFWQDFDQVNGLKTCLNLPKASI